MKIKKKPSKIKEKVCETCGMKKACGDLPGFCMLLYLVPVVLVIAGLAYLLLKMDL